jgi:CHRD domain
MMRNGTSLVGFVVGSLFGIGAPAVAAAEVVTTHLVGYQETPATINSGGSGSFMAKISDDGTSIEYELSYRDLSSTVLQSHIHFGRPSLSGGVALFLCTNLGNAPATVPTPQACPAQPATITGTLTAANVIALPGQGIDSGAAGFAEMLKAIRAGAAYVNVHTMLHPSGEIRGRLSQGGD